MESPNHYELLCIAPDATADEIRASYRRFVRLYHPDVAGASGEAMTLRFNEALRVLIDPALRAGYDRELRMAKSRATAGFTGSAANAGYAGSRSGTGSRTSAGSPGSRTQGGYAGSRSGAGSAESSSFAGQRAGGSSRTQPQRTADPAHFIAWLGVLIASITVIVLGTAIVFEYCYAGPLTFDTPRLEPVLVVALAWLVAALGRPPKFLISLLVIGAAVWPLSLAHVPPFASLGIALPPIVLALPTVLSIAVLTLRASAPRVHALSRARRRAAHPTTGRFHAARG